MPRTRHITLRCAHPGCHETAFGSYDNQRERAEWLKKPYHCYRHTQPDEVLSPESPTRTTTWTVVENEHGRRRIGPPGREYGGIENGPGFKFIADDFPAGSRLVVSVQVLPPLAAAPALAETGADV